MSSGDMLYFRLTYKSELMADESVDMKSRWKKYSAFVSGIIILIFITVSAVVYAVYFGHYHVNGLRDAKYPIYGVDLSHYQGEIDWNVPAAQDIRFAYIKAAEGSSHVDEPYVDLNVFTGTVEEWEQGI